MRPGELEAFEQLASFAVGNIESAVAVEVHEVEDHVGDGHGIGETADAGGLGGVHPRLQGLEARAAPGIEGDDLAVEDDLQ